MEAECFCFRGPPPPFRPSPASRSSEAPARLVLPPRPGPAQRRAGLPPRACSLTRRAARPDRDRGIPPRGDSAPASPAARQPWPGTAPTRPPSPAGARALAHSRPHFLPFSSKAASSELRHRCARAPPASNSRTTAPFSNSSCPELRLAFLEVVLELLRLPSTGRASPRLAADGHGAAVHGRHGIRFLFPLQPRIATLPSSLSPRTSPALARWHCCGRRRSLAAGRAAPPRQRAPARRLASAGQAEPGRGLTPVGLFPPPSRSGHAGR
ncbi:uncharacterized protein [Miscanthus floridulus]|uniref:uncharacterized protein n=1 Tax=Miscanthus floridulus TaxID=154761 RepID=UPI00345AD6BE